MANPVSAVASAQPFLLDLPAVSVNRTYCHGRKTWFIGFMRQDSYHKGKRRATQKHDHFETQFCAVMPERGSAEVFRSEPNSSLALSYGAAMKRWRFRRLSTAEEGKLSLPLLPRSGSGGPCFNHPWPLLIKEGNHLAMFVHGAHAPLKRSRYCSAGSVSGLLRTMRKWSGAPAWA